MQNQTYQLYHNMMLSILTIRILQTFVVTICFNIKDNKYLSLI